MKIDFQRAIDRLLGGPMCLLLSLLDALSYDGDSQCLKQIPVAEALEAARHLVRAAKAT